MYPPFVSSRDDSFVLEPRHVMICSPVVGIQFATWLLSFSSLSSNIPLLSDKWTLRATGIMTSGVTVASVKWTLQSWHVCKLNFVD